MPVCWFSACLFAENSILAPAGPGRGGTTDGRECLASPPPRIRGSAAFSWLPPAHIGSTRSPPPSLLQSSRTSLHFPPRSGGTSRQPVRAEPRQSRSRSKSQNSGDRQLVYREFRESSKPPCWAACFGLLAGLPAFLPWVGQRGSCNPCRCHAQTGAAQAAPLSESHAWHNATAYCLQLLHSRNAHAGR